MSTHPVIEYLASSHRSTELWQINTDKPFFKLLSDISAAEVVSGTLQYKPIKKLTVDGCDYKLKDPNFSYAILKLSTLSGFGAGNILKFDDTVRKAREITADRLQDPFLNNYRLNESVSALLPKHDITCKLHKLAIYQPGGHFLKHRDTNHAPNHLASLIVCLPIPFSGGSLQVDTCEGVKSIDLNTENVTYAAFFTDSPHEVMPVQSGTRMCLQYDVYAEPVQKSVSCTHKSGERSNNSFEDEEFSDEEDYYEDCGWALDNYPPQAVAYSANLAKVEALQQQVQAIIQDGPLAFLCRQLYTSRTVDRTLLKGVDAVVYDAMTAVATVKMCAILIQQSGDDWWAQPFNAKDDMIPAPVLYLGAHEGNCKRTISETPYIEYTGNEPQDAESQYCAYAMVMQYDPSRTAIRQHFAELTLAELRSLPPTSIQPSGGIDYQQAKTRFET